jgi:hypothetical protein
MNKIPVFETIAHAYGFAISQFLKILGIAWAPLVVSIAFGLMITPGFFGNHIDPSDQDAMQRLSMQMVPLSLLILLPIRAMIATGVTELALGMRSGTTFVYFSLGASIWRFIGSWLLVIIAMIVLVVGFAIVLGITLGVGGAALSSMAGTNATMIGGVVGVLVTFIVLFLYLYLIVRLTFFIAPVVVAEHKIDLARVWQLSHGNFWRIFLVGLGIVLPIIIVAFAMVYFVFGNEISHLLEIFREGFKTKNDTVLQTQMQAWSETIRVRQLAIWPYAAVFNLIFATFSYGLMYGASAFAYRAIQPTGGDIRA